MFVCAVSLAWFYRTFNAVLIDSFLASLGVNPQIFFQCIVI